MTPSALVSKLASIRLDSVFNPYADVCPFFDRHDAPIARRHNLVRYIEAAAKMKVDTIWMGRDLGHKGGRRTGIALTDEYHLRELAKLYPGSSSDQATKGPALSERTASEIWMALRNLAVPPFLWNVFPFHPHESTDPLTNRRFTAKELVTVDGLNNELFSWLGIRRIVAIGQDAARYASGYGVPVVAVRHPSYGGIRDFRLGIQEAYKSHSGDSVNFDDRVAV